MENDKCKKVRIKNYMCYYFGEVIKPEGLIPITF